MGNLCTCLLFLVAAATGVGAQTSRPVLPKIPAPVLFNTAEADAIMTATRLFPADSPWHEDIRKAPLLTSSPAMIAAMGADKRIGVNMDMAWVIVPPTQPTVAVKLTAYPAESDRGPYPLPPNAPVENWPLDGRKLDDAQRNGTGDRHVIVLDPVNHRLFEFYQARLTPTGWSAACEATFELGGNKLRPAGWTSADAAGLPILPAVIRFDECERGVIDHALRVTFDRTRRAAIPPATHHAAKSDDPNLPAMGQRLRLKAAVDLGKLSRHARVVAVAMQTHGMFVADNGGDWRISAAPDARLKGLDTLRELRGGDFDVLAPAGEREGTRGR